MLARVSRLSLLHHSPPPLSLSLPLIIHSWHPRPSHPTKQPHASLLRAHFQPTRLSLRHSAALGALCHSATLPPLPPSLSLIHPSLHSFVPLSFFSVPLHPSFSTNLHHPTLDNEHNNIYRLSSIIISGDAHSATLITRSIRRARLCGSCPRRELHPVAILASATTIPPHTSMTRERKQMNTIHQRNQVTL
jgi:hypothetical protein